MRLKRLIWNRHLIVLIRTPHCSSPAVEDAMPYGLDDCIKSEQSGTDMKKNIV